MRYKRDKWQNKSTKDASIRSRTTYEWLHTHIEDTGIYRTWRAYPEKHRSKSLAFQTLHTGSIENEIHNKICVCNTISLSSETFCCKFDWIALENEHSIQIHILNHLFNGTPQLRTIPSSSKHHELHWNQWTRLQIIHTSFCSTLITTNWIRNFIFLEILAKISALTHSIKQCRYSMVTARW